VANPKIRSYNCGAVSNRAPEFCEEPIISGVCPSGATSFLKYFFRFKLIRAGFDPTLRLITSRSVLVFIALATVIQAQLRAA